MWTWISDIFRSFLSLFDRIVYWFLGLLVSLFDQLTGAEIFDQTTRDAFSNRIFFLISIIMIFKVSFSIIKYIINPDEFSNNEHGMGKLVQNVIVVLVCLVGIRYVFDLANNLQKTILDSQVIEKLVLGIENGPSKEEQIEAKEKIPFNLLMAFVKPNITDVKEFGFKNGIYTCKLSGKDEEMYNIVDGMKGDYRERFGVCINEISNEGSTKSYTNANGQNVTGKKTGDMYNAAQQTNNYSMLLDLINDKYKGNPDRYIFDYKFILSTATGIFALIMYLNFCIDLAIRTVKFGFLQIIAPIPIISMIDPKSSKNGAMNKWVKNCINTYLGLFIRIFAVNFVVFVINLVFTNKVINMPSGDVGIFIPIVILFGALMFAKELPKLIEELFNINLSGNFKMNPFSRLPGAKLGGAIAGGVAGIGGAFVGGGLKTGGAALGSLAQAGWGAARGKGWNYNSDRVANAWRNTGHNVGTRAIGALNNVKKNMHIPGKDFPEPFGDKSDSEYWSSMRHGEKLDKMVRAGKNIYSNSDFADEVAKYSDLKRRLGEARAIASQMATNPNSTPEQISSANKYASDLEKQSNMVKEKIEKMGARSRYKSDYRNYKDYKAYTDLNDNVVQPDNIQTQNTTSNSSGGTVIANSNVTNAGGSSSSGSSSYSSSSYSSGNNTGGSMPSVGRNNNQNSSGNNTGGSIPSVGRNNNQNSSGNNTSGSMPSVGRNNNNP